MIILPLQYDRHSGPDAVGSHKLVFTMDESISSDFNPMGIKKGTQFLVMLVETQEIEEFSIETKEQTLTRFRKHMNALMTDVASLLSIEPTAYRETYKAKLRQQGLIKESTNELSIEGISSVILDLKTIKMQHGRRQ